MCSTSLPVSDGGCALGSYDFNIGVIWDGKVMSCDLQYLQTKSLTPRGLWTDTEDGIWRAFNIDAYEIAPDWEIN